MTLVPKAMFAALLVTSGLNLLMDHLTNAYSIMKTSEFVLVLLHIGLTAALGMLSAVLLGMLLTAVIFIVQYSSHSGVLQSATILLERSKVRVPAWWCARLCPCVPAWLTCGDAAAVVVTWG